MSPPPPMIAIPIVMFTLVFTVVGIGIYRHQAYTYPFRKAMTALVPIHLQPPEKFEPSSIEYEERIREDVRGDTYHKVHARLAEERVSGRGEQVWLAFGMREGQERQFAMLTGGHKWELMPTGEMASSKKTMLLPSVMQRTVGEERYRYALTPSNAIVLLSLVGWTTKSPQDITAISSQAVTKFGKGPYVPEAKAHMYTRHLASQIMSPTDRAADWDWLHVCTASERQFRVRGKPYTPPAAVAATWLQRISMLSQSLLSADQLAVMSLNTKMVQEHVLQKEEDYVASIMMSDKRFNVKGGAKLSVGWSGSTHGGKSRGARSSSDGDGDGDGDGDIEMCMFESLQTSKYTCDGLSDWGGATGKSSEGSSGGGDSSGDFGSSSGGGGGDGGGGGGGGGGGS